MKHLHKNQKLVLHYFLLAITILLITSACSKKENSTPPPVVKDNIQPALDINGDKEMILFLGDFYNEPGAVATDNIDGDISSNIKIIINKDNVATPNIDTENVGEYLVTYSISDSSGNKNEITRKIKIEKNNSIYVNSKSATLKESANRKSKSVATLHKGTSLFVLSESADDEKTVWLNVEYMEKKDKKTAWIKKEATVGKKEELILEKYRNLDYTPIEKIQYPNNPKVKVKGIYLTVYSAGGAKLDTLIEMTKRTEINAFVIDVKDDNGKLLFPMKAGEKYSPNANKNTMIKDISATMKKLKDNNIYTIARIVSFKDPIYTETHPDRAIIYKDSGKVFTNSDNLPWATAYDRQLWEYNIAVAKEAVAAGFNEVQFDYVRFPASNGGKLDNILDYRNSKNETKSQAIQGYLKYARQELSPLGVYISADVYGLVASVEDDMALGQYWEAVSNMVDYVCPMMYPSHYGNGVYGLSVPDAFLYETVNLGTKDALIRNNIIKTPATIRPWIQDFTAAWVKGHITYGENELRAQIKALKDNGVDEYLLWNATNRYTESAIRR